MARSPSSTAAVRATMRTHTRQHRLAKASSLIDSPTVEPHSRPGDGRATTVLPQGRQSADGTSTKRSRRGS